MLVKPSIWTKAIADSAAPDRVEHFLQLLGAPLLLASRRQELELQARILAALFSGSPVLSRLLVSRPEWVSIVDAGCLKYPRHKTGLVKEVAAWLPNMIKRSDYARGFSRLREFKQREMLRIAARDLGGLGSVVEITRELSDLADVCLGAAWDLCQTQFLERYGQPYFQDANGKWRVATGCVMGMGKLGGQELNYNSDVDLVFVYSEEGSVFRSTPGKGKTQRPVLGNHQFYVRLAEAFIGEVTRMAAEGAIYRIDMRLRPEGDAGPLSRSLPSYENYYAQWGQTWERMMLIKARGVAGDLSLAAEFVETIHPFRYPRSFNPSALQEVAAMKDRIESEVVKAGELDRNVKLGRGGIREVEFVAQSLQLLHAGRQPFLQGAQTLPILEKLAEYQLLEAADADALAVGYCFLRRVEHRLQMEENRQTHSIPEERQARDRLARLMGLANARELEFERKKHSEAIRRIFENLLRGQPVCEVRGSRFPREFQGFEEQWRALLMEFGFRDPEKAVRVLREFVEGPGYVHVSARTRELAFQLVPRLFRLCTREPVLEQEADLQGGVTQTDAPLSDPDRVVTRLDSFITAYGARATLFELWNSNPAVFELLVLLFDRSEFLAELAIRTPDLVDELVSSGRLRSGKVAGETLRDLRYGLGDTDQYLWLRRYHQAELMRIGLRDILGLADFEQHLTELSALADACLQYALDVVMRRHKLRTAPFAVIGLGKLGGSEIDYGSDLDIVFVAEKSDGRLPRLAVELIDLVSARTQQGALFQTDARLRPDGEKGLLVNRLKAYEDYYRHRAQLWEIQTLTRARVVAGDLKLGARFLALAGRLTDFRKPNMPLAAWGKDWKQDVHRMRMRIERERTPAGKAELAIKTGVGGLMDVEFIAQTLCLGHGWHEPNTLRALERASAAGVLPEAPNLIQTYCRLRRVEGILRRWSYEGETVLPDEPEPYRRVSIRCGFETPDTFRSALAAWRETIRRVYLRVFPSF